MKMKIISICCLLAAVILMMLPFGVAMTFAYSPTEPITRYYSYFDLMPFGYGDWCPAIAALCSLTALCLLFLSIVKVSIGKAVPIFLGIAIMATAFSWLIFHTISFVGVCIMILQIVVFVLQIPSKTGSAK